MTETLQSLPGARAIGNALVTPKSFVDRERIARLLDQLRAHGRPVWAEPDDYRPFWVVTRHDQIVKASMDNDTFISRRRLNLMSRVQEAAAFRGAQRYGQVLRTLIHMDEPDHTQYRLVTQQWFGASSIRRLGPMLDELSTEFADKFTRAAEPTTGIGQLDFAAEVSVWYPLRVVMNLLGVPLSDLELMHRLTKTLAAPQDPDFSDDASSGESMFDSIPLFTEYFLDLLADRRRTPRDDLSTIIAHGKIAGGPMGELETVSYYITMLVAGHDTTAAAMGGGLEALALRPALWAQLSANPSLLRSAADEMIRWVTPIKHMMRTTSRDTELGGQPLRAGEAIAMFYVAANYDEAVFPDPYHFDIERTPNRQLAFGHGPHVCLGMGLSRMELMSLFGELGRRLESVSLDGVVQPIASNFLSGFKSIPVRYTLAPSARTVAATQPKR